MKVTLVRHGETDWNKVGRMQGRLDIDLNLTGIRQAHYCMKKLQNYQFDAIYSSPQRRAFQTAEIINTAFDLPIITSENLQEIDLGTWQGCTWREIQIRNRHMFSEFEKGGDFSSIYGGESWLEVRERMMSFLQSLLFTGKKDILIVSHGGAIRMLLSGLLDIPLSKRMTLDIYNLALSKVRYDESKKKWYVECINEYSYLDEMLEKKSTI